MEDVDVTLMEPAGNNSYTSIDYRSWYCSKFRFRCDFRRLGTGAMTMMCVPPMPTPAAGSLTHPGPT